MPLNPLVMKFLFTIIYCILFIYAAGAQRVVTLDPEKDAIATRTADGSLAFTAPLKALAASIQNALPEISGIDSLCLKKFGRSNYLVVSGKKGPVQLESVGVAILLVETTPGQFQTDNLVVICSSSGDCRECATPPTCTCSKGEGLCSQSAAMTIALKKVTLTLSE